MANKRRHGNARTINQLQAQVNALVDEQNQVVDELASLTTRVEALEPTEPTDPGGPDPGTTDPGDPSNPGAV